MSLYRCAACGSSRVTPSSENSGYSYSKGLLGSLILGSGGAAAGVNGKSKTVYKCAACGLTLDAPMPDEWKNLIDKGVNIPSSRKNLTLNGVKFDWDFIIEQFPNIEYAADDIPKKQVDYSVGIASDFEEDDLEYLDDLQKEVLFTLKKSARAMRLTEIHTELNGDARGFSVNFLSGMLRKLVSLYFVTKTTMRPFSYYEYGSDQYEKRRSLEKNILCFMQQMRDKGINFVPLGEIEDNCQEQGIDDFSYTVDFLEQKGFITKIREDEKLCCQLTETCTPPSASCPSSEVPDILRKYKSLLDDGIITEEEFEAKKKELLNL